MANQSNKGLSRTYEVVCMMCGRKSGKVEGGVFYRYPGVPPLRNKGERSLCGFCSGNLYLEIPQKEEKDKEGLNP